MGRPDHTEVAEVVADLRDEVDRAIARACEQYRSWLEKRLVETGIDPPTDIAHAHRDLLALSRGQDALYDRPSIGLLYATWYQARRIKLILDSCLPIWAEEWPDGVLDLGSGTGATAWALAITAHALTQLDADPPTVAVTAIDASPPMLDAAEHLWCALGSDPVFGEAARRIDLTPKCANWRDPTLILSEHHHVVASYLWDHSETTELDEVATAFRHLADRVQAQRVTVITATSKENVASAVARALTGSDRAPFLEPDTQEGEPSDLRLCVPVPWSGRAPRLNRLYADLLASTGRPIRSVTFHDRGSTARGFRRQWIGEPVGPLLLDADQQRAAEPDDRLTLVTGTAGSGKSIVLVERIRRLLERSQRRPVDVLVTAFNKDLVWQLRRWLTESLDLDEEPHPQLGDRARSLAARGGRVTFLNWDKVVSRLFEIPYREVPEHKRFADSVTAFIDRVAPDDADWATPTFLEAELQRVIWGLRYFTRDQYLNGRRAGRVRRLPKGRRDLVWRLMVGNQDEISSEESLDPLVMRFTHRRILAYLSGPARHVFTHLFIDEAQDFTPADFALAGRLVEDANHITAFGDAGQALHLASSYQVPGTVQGRNGQPRRWKRDLTLTHTYRLPRRVIDAVGPVHTLLGEVEDPELAELVASGSPRGVRAGPPGIRPVVVTGGTKSLARALGDVIHWYRWLLDRDGQVCLAENIDPLDPAVVSDRICELEARFPRGCPDGGVDLSRTRITVAQESMLKIKGLERRAVVWSTRARLRADESELHWIWVILTRTSGLLVILLSRQPTPEAVEVLRRLDKDRLLFWNAEAERLFDRLTGST